MDTAMPSGLNYLTSAASARLTELGCYHVSPSLLRKLRRKTADAPGDHGPRWFRHPNRHCVYFEEDLAAYAAERSAALKEREHHLQPAHLRSDRSAA